MLKTLIGTALFAFALLTGCTSLSTLPPAGSSPRVEGTPGKAVVYLVRTRPDISYLAAPLIVDDRMIGATHAGTYFRLELTPGRHQIRGYGEDPGVITLDLQGDRVYFIQQSVAGSWRATNPQSFFTMLTENRGRAALVNTQNAGNV
jgi:hypothetical protein